MTRMIPNPRLYIGVALVLAFTVGLAAGLFAMWRASPEPALAPAAKDVRPCDGIRVAASEAKQYIYSEDWFTENIPVWRRHLVPLRDRPLNYLEIGVFEGRSLFWMLENVLTHKDSRATVVDVTMFPNYAQNLARSGFCGKVRNIADFSQRALRAMPVRETFDIIYVDGSHLAADVLADAVLAFDLLKTGGLIVFDDYGWVRNWADELRPQVSIDSFITAYRQRLKIVHRDYQVIVQKREHPCSARTERMSQVDKYCYQWESGELSRQTDGLRVPISAQEKQLIEAIARSPRFGEVDPVIDAKLRRHPAFGALDRRLKLTGS